MMDFSEMTAGDISRAVRAGDLSARTVTEAALERIAALDPALGAFTDVTAERAIDRARAIDRTVTCGGDPGPLAGVPMAAKNLFDIEGVVTRAGSKINRDNRKAARNATLIDRLEAAGAVTLGALNMGEYAYDFTGQNVHDGPSRNPHAAEHMSGGSSGGSGTAVGAGMVPLALGSDTNGSIRVPSAFCGIFGLKPTYGRLSRGRTFPFVASLDHLGPFARTTFDLALAYDAMLGPDPADPALTDRPDEPISALIGAGLDGLRIARATGYFERGGDAQTLEAVTRIAAALGTTATVDIEGAAQARASAYLITMAEGAALHLGRLKDRAADFDPDVRDRLIAGAMIPGAWVVKAQKYRRIFAARMARLFKTTDVILAPSTPCPAPLIGQKTFVLDGEELPLRPNIGIYTQPISFIGLPVVNVPVWTEGKTLPVGVQIIAAPWREDVAMRVAGWLERQGVVFAPVAKG